MEAVRTQHPQVVLAGVAGEDIPAAVQLLARLDHIAARHAVQVQAVVDMEYRGGLAGVGEQQPHHAFAEMRSEGFGQDETVGEHMVDPRRARGTRIREPVHLHRRGTHGQRFRRAAAAPAAQVEEHVDAFAADALRHLRERQAAHVVQARGRLQAAAHQAAVVAVEREQVDVERIELP